MKNLKSLKQEIINRGKAHDACTEGLKAVESSKNKVELLQAILRFWLWCFEHEEIIDEQYILDNFTKEEIGASNIYLPPEKKAYEEYVKTLPYPSEGWETILLNNGKTLTIARTNHKDDELSFVNPANKEHYFTHDNAMKAAEKAGCRLPTNEEHVQLCDF